MAALIHQVLLVLVFGVVGGVIGYATNVLAVKMLFHPKRKRCIPLLGFCIQGLLPSRKDELAERLGEVFQDYMASMGVEDKYMDRLNSTINTVIRETLESRIPSITPLRSISNTLTGTLASTLTPLIVKLVREASTRIDLKSIVVEELKTLDTREMEEIFKTIAGRELRFIELAGFIVGFIIGVAEGLVALTL